MDVEQLVNSNVNLLQYAQAVQQIFVLPVLNIIILCLLRTNAKKSVAIMSLLEQKIAKI